jgi:membrane complex biogenesis BtpA family protein
MVHLWPLPGAPRAKSLRETIAAAVHDAETIAAAGFDAICMENFGDAPFYPRRVPRLTVSAMTAAAVAIRSQTNLPLGLNVLRNDAESALAIAACVGASFIRVNVLTGAMLTDQGIIEARAHHVARLRDRICPIVHVFADVLVKHAQPLGSLPPLEQLVHDTIHRAGADALIVSGSGTGRSVDDERLAAVSRLSDVPVYVGSGATPDTASHLLRHAHGLIVGTAIKSDDGPISPARAAALVAAAN